MQFPFCKRHDISLGSFPIINHLNRCALQKPLTGICVLLPIKQIEKKKEIIQAGALAVLLLKIAMYKMYRKLGSSGQQKSSVNELI